MGRHYASITPQAFAYGADHVEQRDTVADHTKREDYRSVTVYYRHDQAAWTTERIKDATIIGVVLGLDDPGFTPEALSRDDARELFGDDAITGWEALQSEEATKW